MHGQQNIKKCYETFTTTLDFVISCERSKKTLGPINFWGFLDQL